MKKNLVLTFTSNDRPGIVDDLTKVVVHHGGNWEESRLARLCGDFAGIARISVAENQIDDLRVALEKLDERGLRVQCKSADAAEHLASSTNATLVCDGADHEGIVHGLASMLSEQGINVEELETSVAPAPTSGIPLFTMSCRVSIPEDCELTELRSELARLEQELAVEITLTGDDTTDA